MCMCVRACMRVRVRVGGDVHEEVRGVGRLLEVDVSTSIDRSVCKACRSCTLLRQWRLIAQPVCPHGQGALTHMLMRSHTHTPLHPRP